MTAVKRKVNPSRKADDGWTSVKYNGELLSVYRPKLEELISLGIGGSRTPLGPSLSAPSPRASPLRSSQPRRKKRRVHIPTWLVGNHMRIQSHRNQQWQFIR